jgi:hypothetical protein
LSGLITEFKDGKHLVLYDDGTKKWYTMKKKTFWFEGEKPDDRESTPGVSVSSGNLHQESQYQPAASGLAQIMIPIHTKLTVLWARNQKYSGTVIQYESQTQKHLVRYVDGDQKWYNMQKKTFWLEGQTGFVASHFVPKQSATAAHSSADAARTRGKADIDASRSRSPQQVADAPDAAALALLHKKIVMQWAHGKKKTGKL